MVNLIRTYLASDTGRRHIPQVYLVDGNGRLHERQAGLATTIGVWANVPTIGVAKEYYVQSDLAGRSDGSTDFRKSQKAFKKLTGDLLKRKGDWITVLDQAEEQVMGAVCPLSRFMKYLG